MAVHVLYCTLYSVQYMYWSCCKLYVSENTATVDQFYSGISQLEPTQKTFPNSVILQFKNMSGHPNFGLFFLNKLCTTQHRDISDLEYFWAIVSKLFIYRILYLSCTVGMSVEFFFDRTEQVKQPKVRHDFKSPNPKFRRARRRRSAKVFIFKKFQGA